MLLCRVGHILTAHGVFIRYLVAVVVCSYYGWVEVVNSVEHFQLPLCGDIGGYFQVLGVELLRIWILERSICVR